MTRHVNTDTGQLTSAMLHNNLPHWKLQGSEHSVPFMRFMTINKNINVTPLFAIEEDIEKKTKKTAK